MVRQPGEIERNLHSFLYIPLFSPSLPFIGSKNHHGFNTVYKHDYPAVIVMPTFIFISYKFLFRLAAFTNVIRNKEDFPKFASIKDNQTSEHSDTRLTAWRITLPCFASSTLCHQPPGGPPGMILSSHWSIVLILSSDWSGCCRRCRLRARASPPSTSRS